MRKEAVLSSKGQVTLPKDIRDALGLQAGDSLLVSVQQGQLVLTPKNVSFNDLAGFLSQPPNGPASLSDIEDAVATEMSRAATSVGVQPRGKAA